MIDTLGLGSLVEHPDVAGIGRIGAVDGRSVRVDCFESVAVPVAWSGWLPADECRHVRLLNQTRVYWQDPDTGNWSSGRVVGSETRGIFRQACRTLSSMSGFPKNRCGFAGIARSPIQSRYLPPERRSPPSSAMRGCQCYEVSSRNGPRAQAFLLCCPRRSRFTPIRSMPP